LTAAALGHVSAEMESPERLARPVGTRFECRDCPRCSVPPPSLYPEKNDRAWLTDTVVSREELWRKA